MKKLITTLMIVVIIFNFIFSNVSLADGEGISGKKSSLTTESITDIIEYGSVDGVKLDILSRGILFGSIAAIIATILNIVPAIIHLGMWGATGADVTIESLVFNKVPFFNVDYFNFSDTYSVGSGTNKVIYKTNSTNILLKESISKYFYIFRLLATAFELVILIYVGIRMALSTTSSKKSKYKQMLLGWFESIIILFLLQYIIGAIFGISDFFENMFYDLKCIISKDSVSFERLVLKRVEPFLGKASGWTYVMYSVMYWFITFLELKFFVSYFKRLITVGFLILISPFISVIYSIDKAGDGKAQSFSIWLKELSLNVFIQPIYAIVYITFMYTAGEIAEYSMLFALIITLAMTKIEKFIFTLFKLSAKSLKPIEQEHKKNL